MGIFIKEWKMKSIGMLALLLSSSHLAFAGESFVETRVPECHYTELSVNVPSTIHMVAQGKPTGRVKGVASELKLLKYHCAKGVLYIDIRNNVLINQGFAFNLANGLLNRVTLNGAEQMQVTKLNTKTLDVTVNGSGRVVTIGKVESLNVSLNGAGYVNASTLEAKTGNIMVNGSGLIKVKLSDRLNASVNGAGSIEYVGQPSTLKKDVIGSGSILSVK